jgi:hypothetical protein
VECDEGGFVVLAAAVDDSIMAVPCEFGSSRVLGLSAAEYAVLPVMLGTAASLLLAV